MKGSGGGCVGGAGSGPTICAGIVSPAGVQLGIRSNPSPDDHFTASPDCRVKSASIGRVDAGGCPTIRARIVSAAGVQIAVADINGAAPDDHFTAGPDCGVTELGQ